MNLLLIRLIIFAVLFLAGLKLYRLYREWKLEQEQHDDLPEGGKMVRCAWCQVHVPEDEALRDKPTAAWFCCSAHRDRFLQEHDPEA
ncbi:PP0621 family protein [Halomonas faecis]|uniref:PP0621 family protein n=1 Tax=Halomonas faecis TaxID=1562110 RepID=UPI0013D54D9A|nr:PP0621 family protein [Halomonas faecis]